MFKLECLVDDKKLAGVMHVLNGLVYDLKIVPVMNTQVKNGKVHAVHSGSVVEFVQNYIVKRKLTDFNTTQIADAVIKAGWSKRNAANYALNSLREQKFVGLVKRGKANSAAIWRVL
jgi:hypothetical protein